MLEIEDRTFVDVGFATASASAPSSPPAPHPDAWMTPGLRRELRIHFLNRARQQRRTPMFRPLLEVAHSYRKPA